jgi:hypothetical protein
MICVVLPLDTTKPPDSVNQEELRHSRHWPVTHQSSSHMQVDNCHWKCRRMTWHAGTIIKPFLIQQCQSAVSHIYSVNSLYLRQIQGSGFLQKIYKWRSFLQSSKNPPECYLLSFLSTSEEFDLNLISHENLVQNSLLSHAATCPAHHNLPRCATLNDTRWPVSDTQLLAAQCHSLYMWPQLIAPRNTTYRVKCNVT